MLDGFMGGGLSLAQKSDSIVECFDLLFELGCGSRVAGALINDGSK